MKSKDSIYFLTLDILKSSLIRFGFGTSEEVLPVAPIYSVASNDDLQKPMNTIFQAPPNERRSFVASTFDLSFISKIPKLTHSQISYISTATGYFDIQSLVARPDEHKYTDILKALQLDSVSKSVSGNNSPKSQSIKEYENLTIEEISKLLCNNPHCPAAKKFKEFGIGPLATGKGLGTIYGPVNPPVSYGKIFIIKF